MKINSTMSISGMTPIKSDTPRTVSSSTFNAQFIEASSTGGLSGDRTSFTAKSLSASLDYGKANVDRASSSSIVSRQAKPYLSDDEVSFFEKMMRKVPTYTSGGVYAQNAPEIGTTYSFKA